MTSHARLALIMSLSLWIPFGGSAPGQSGAGSTPGNSTATGAGPASEAEAEPFENGDNKKKICAAICTYDAAPAGNKAQAAAALATALESLVSQGGEKTGECDCNGKTVTYRVQKGSGKTEVKGSEDIVMAITTDSTGSKTAGKAIATNTGSGDAIASAGSNTGSGAGGSAEATALSGDAYASGGDSSEAKTGGSATATTSSGTANATGGAGGNLSGSTSLPGGQGGTATANYGSTPLVAGGVSPILPGMHGSQTLASITVVSGSLVPTVSFGTLILN